MKTGSCCSSSGETVSNAGPAPSAVCVDALVRERAGGAGNHALAAGDAGGFAHGLVVVEGDSGLGAFAHAAEHEILANLAAAADAAVAQDAGVEIHGDAHRGIVFGARRWTPRRSAAACTFSCRASVSSSQSPECCWRAQGEGWSDINISISVRRARCTFSDAVVTTMPVSAGRTHDAVNTRAPTSTTHNAADAHGRFVLLVAQRGNGDVVHARGVEDGRSRRHGDFLAVDGEFDEAGRAHACLVAA